ncbi:MAG TPA: hypothetical protein VFF07_13335 [Actinomycetota bacterium]|nr:hypothetical protein [Actinomycetota bacterium]
MKWTILIRLYPQRWRNRYEDEMGALLEEGPVSVRDGLDLLRGALEAHLIRDLSLGPEPRPQTTLGGVMEHPVPARRSATVAALFLCLPATFLFSVTMKYGFGYDTIFDSLESFWTFKPIEYITVLSPLAALFLSVAPALRAKVERDGGVVKGALVVQAGAARIAVAAVSSGMLFLFFVYFLTENF